MALGLGHKKNEGARIRHAPTGKTIDVVVVDWEPNGEWVKVEIYGGDCDNNIMLRKGKRNDIRIAENLTIGIGSNWEFDAKAHVCYMCPKEYNIERLLYPPYLRENLRKQYSL